MKLDQYQQEVVDCNRNAVISAGAGSGKTTVLARRFLRLIEQGRAGVSEILTLTFTRKAAAEMYERIYSLLIENISSPLSAEAVAGFDKAAISTLDSFCSRIARDCCTDFGVPPSFKTDETAARTLAEDVSLDFILSNSKNPYLKDFIFINGFENVRLNFFVHISMDYLAVGRPVDFTEVFEAQMKTAEAGLLKAAAAADDLADEIKRLPADASKAVEGAQQKLAVIPSFRELAESGDIAGLAASAGDLKLTKPGGRSVRDEIVRYKEIVDLIRPAVDSLIELACTLENRDLIEGLFRLTAEFQEELFSRKRSSGILGFHDVLTMAVAGLRNDPGLRRHYKSLFRYIMIDEFQDNNSLQKELLYLLSERDGYEGEGIPAAADLNPEKLFFVGDEKQSIYRFRGADVSVFKQLSDELERSGGVSLSLKKNYRSEPGLIEFFNDIFSGVMRDSSEDYQASFEPLEAREAAISSSPDIRLLYKPYEKELPEDSLTAEESEARAIAEYILDAVGRLEIPENDGRRPAEFSDFAMLFRSGTNQKTYEQVFRSMGIPYSVHSVRSLFQEAPVNDIYNLLQICLYPDDRTASAAFLRSPLINLSDLSVVRFLLSGRPVFAGDQQACCVNDQDLDKYRRAKGLYSEIISKIDLEPMAEIMDDIWYGSGYRYLILRDSSLHGYLEYYDYLRRLAVNHDEQNKTAAEFLDYIRSNLGDYKKIDDLKILGYSAGGVEMMPVHQSKGLEFPVVILANAGNTGVNDRGGSSPAYISEVDGLSFNLMADSREGIIAGSGRCNYFYSRGKEENQAREDAELRRLLYVALTRAENHLVISGCHGRQNRSGERSMLNIFLSALGWSSDTDPFSYPRIEPYIRLIRNRTWSGDGGLKKEIVNIAAVAKLYNSAEPVEFRFLPNEFPATELNARSAGRKAPEQAEAGNIRVLPELNPSLEKILAEKGFEAEFGTLAHSIIEYCIKNTVWKELPDEESLSAELRPFFRNPDDVEWDRMLKGACGLAESFFSSELWLSSSRASAPESELAFTALCEEEGGDVYVNGIMDLVFEFEDSVRIIDFKTDRRIIPGEYDRQMEIYIDAASEIYGKPAECSLFYLRGGVEVKI